MGVIPLSDPPSLALSTLSTLLGWAYTFAWSASFYPQVIRNFTHKSTIGLSTDFVVLNAVGHSSYLLYNTLLLFYGPVRRAYRHAHGGRENVVQLNDFIFSLHATLLALITLAQFLRYRKAHQGVSRTVSLSLAGALTVAVFLAGAKRLKLVNWLHIVNAASTLKLVITLTKYLPQIKLNADRESTKGFSIENILLDLTGGLLSLAQLGVDAVWIQGSWSGVAGDWGKLGLGLLSIAFDGVLIWQHYGVYGAVEVDEDDEREETPDGTGRRRSGYGSLAGSRQASYSSRRANQDGETEDSALLR
ncbi:Lysosomal cystine transporter [Kalmanozyma brasiliensis GHG001]|uniref:Cystinosin n=1 Tax=Kalmanozyma brasiliensis (strain GHG001) TaxID=1365824 RepID=V5ECM7_KALBG|nr:Lysosomal cystine transporter [Kalmanozyma brasiliensis GHG001]EST08191.1 Lysosomal cystine transporter [Kalmanozyma brasiliensis GHG001]